MIVKVVEKRGPFVASSDGPTESLGDQTTWIEGVHRAQIVEEIESVPIEGADSFFRATHYFGVVASREDFEAEVQRALQSGNVLPLPKTRYRVVWLYFDGGRLQRGDVSVPGSEVVEQLVMGDAVTAYLMTDGGQTIDRLR